MNEGLALFLAVNIIIICSFAIIMFLTHLEINIKHKNNNKYTLKTLEKKIHELHKTGINNQSSLYIKFSNTKSFQITKDNNCLNIYLERNPKIEIETSKWKKIFEINGLIEKHTAKDMKEKSFTIKKSLIFANLGKNPKEAYEIIRQGIKNIINTENIIEIDLDI